MVKTVKTILKLKIYNKENYLKVKNL